MGPDIANAQNHLARYLSLHGQVVVKGVRSCEVVRDHTEVEAKGLKLSEIDARRSRSGRFVRERIRKREAAGDIRKRIWKRRRVRVGGGRTARHSQRIQAKRGDPQILQVEFLFTAVKVKPKSGADRGLARSAGHAPSPIWRVRETQAWSEVIVLCAGTALSVAALVACQSVARGSRGEDRRLQDGLEADPRNTLVLIFGNRCINLVSRPNRY